jgi:hypothetical protein
LKTQYKKTPIQKELSNIVNVNSSKIKYIVLFSQVTGMEHEEIIGLKEKEKSIDILDDIKTMV